jgi:hypothetical protein
METPSKLRYAIAGTEQKVVVLRTETAWLQNGTNRRELTAGQFASWTELSMAFLPLLLMDLARGESVVTELDDGGNGVQVFYLGQQVFTLHCTVSGRVSELRGPTLQIGFSEFTENVGLLLPKNLYLQSRGEELNPLPMIETWTMSKWQVNLPRQPHWFQLPTGY